MLPRYPHGGVLVHRVRVPVSASTRPLLLLRVLRMMHGGSWSAGDRTAGVRRGGGNGSAVAGEEDCGGGLENGAGLLR